MPIDYQQQIEEIFGTSDLDELRKLAKMLKINNPNPRNTGRKAQLTPDQTVEVLELHRKGIGNTEIAKQFGVSRQTIYKYIYNAEHFSTDPDFTMRMNFMNGSQLCTVIDIDFKHADNFVEVEFESNDGREISAERAPDDTIEVLMVEPGQYPRVERIGSDLASLQKAVDGYIEAIYPYDDPVALICGEEAKLEGKPLNRALRDGDGDIYDIVAGKFFICGLGDENFASLPKELQQKYEEKFRQPEAFLKMGSKIMAIPTEPAKAAGKGKTAPVTER